MPPIDRSVVANLPSFAGLAPGELDEILREARSIRYPKGAAVFAQGADADSFFALLHGHLRVVKTTPRGQQIVVRYVSPGEIFGVAKALGLKAYPATAIAAVESVALCWRSVAWPRLTEKFPSLTANALRTVGQRLQETQARVFEMSSEQIEQRIAHVLLRLAKQAGRKTQAGIEIEFPVSRQNIAEMVGSTLHTVSRILSAWEQQDLIEGGRQRIVLRNPHKLLVLAERHARSTVSSG
ncbi:Crp/Fnr family transcriptional regulator [Bradyrhizobium erythrophlei]|uniref:Crp/Fnr family transcriptional regulator n=1 Tax=Bradyrhizobium erythrophlei TaxID=1437360 RepID=UPI0035E7A9DC